LAARSSRLIAMLLAMVILQLGSVVAPDPAWASGLAVALDKSVAAPGDTIQFTALQFRPPCEPAAAALTFDATCPPVPETVETVDCQVAWDEVPLDAPTLCTLKESVTESATESVIEWLLSGSFSVPNDATTRKTYVVTVCQPACSDVFRGALLSGQARLRIEESPVLVPDVVGLLADPDALQRLTVLGLTMVLSPPGADPSSARVVEQKPTAGTPVVPPSSVTLTVTPLIRVPNIVDELLPEARRKVEDAGLILDATGDPTGRIGTQDPAPGTLVDPETTVTVTLTVAASPPPVPPVSPSPVPPASPSPVPSASPPATNAAPTADPSGPAAQAPNATPVALTSFASPLALWLIVILAAGAAGLSLRWKRRERKSRHAMRQRVRAVAHDPLPSQVRVEEIDHGRTHSVRLEPHADRGHQQTQEVPA